MGAIDLVVQIESPGVGRARPAAHRPRRPPGRRAVRGPDLPEVPRRPASSAPSSTRRMQRGRDRGDPRAGATRSTCSSQQIVAACATDEWQVDDLFALVRRALPVPRAAAAPVRRRARHAVGPLSVRRLRRAAAADRLGPHRRQRHGPARTPARWRSRTPARSPTAACYGVFLADGSGRVGELDEEMVYEARVGQVFVLGASSWRIERITRDRVLVSPAPGQAGPDPVLEGRGARPPGRARPRDRRVRARDRRAAPRRAP